MRDDIYIPIEKMSPRQYLSLVKMGYWEGKSEPKILELIKDNPDNPYLTEEDITTPYVVE